MKASQRWYRGLDEKEKQVMTNHLEGSALVFERLTKVLMDEKESVIKDMSKETGYDVNSWPFKQADYIASLRILQWVIDQLPTYEDKK